MVGLLTCPVCTLYLRPGMTLEDHLETHPKDQMIKALVSLATVEQRPIMHQPMQPLEEQPLALAKRSVPSNPVPSGYDQHCTFSTPPPPGRPNVMIVNRHSTMVYHAPAEREQPPRMITQPNFMGPPQLQIFTLAHHNQNKALPPPPAYGTAINQLRSQQNQNSISFQSQPLPPPSSTLRPPSSHVRPPSNPAALDFAMPRNLTPRPSPSPSVLRYAESPVSAHYVERENGDFIVQETPRHVVECVEKDNGEFSVIEKVIQSPPSVVQFNESDNDESILPDFLDSNVEPTENQLSDDDDVQTETDASNKASVLGVTVLSNVKLDANESLELMENLGNMNTTQAEIIWSGLAEIKKENNVKESDILENYEIVCKETEQACSSATSVIRLASNNASASHKEKGNPVKQVKNARELPPMKRVFRKHPKKLTVKFKVAVPTTEAVSSDVIDDLGTSSTTTQVQSNVDLVIAEETLPKSEDLTISSNSSSQLLQEPEQKEPAFQSKNGDSKSIVNEQINHVTDETDVKPVQLEIAHPMIVHEPSLSQEPNFELNAEFLAPKLMQSSLSPLMLSSLPATIQFEQTTEQRELELSKLLDECVRNEKNQSYPLSSTSTTTTNTSSDADKTSSTNYTDDIVNSESPKIVADSTTFNSFPSTTVNSFSKPSTSSFALREQQQIQSTEYNAEYPFGLLYGCANAAEDQPWSRYIMQQQMPQLQELESERSSYIDLDTYKITSCDVTSIPNALNIRTDEKMPAKGEISEQESTGDVENSWSNPHSGFRIINTYEEYTKELSEIWNGSNDEAVPYSHNFASGLKATAPQDVSEIEEVKPITESCIKIEKVITRRPKQFQCAHCGVRYPLLKERNVHLIEKHGYKRVNRRLVRDMPPSTVTTETRIPTSDVPDENNLAVEDIKPEVKPEITLTSTVDATVFPRTKYDSIRAGVYRMLMNFNLNVLQETKSIEVDKAYFESKSFCCFVCKRDFISVKLFDEHLAEHPAECFTCGRKFTRWTYFSLHLKRHLGWKDFACTVCDKKFVIRSALIEHMRMHTGIAPLKCTQCEKQFKRYSNLAQHKKVCLSARLIKKKDYVCHCGEVLPSKARFIWHKETHETKPKVCPYCRDRFVHRNSLKRHIRLTHSEKFNYVQPVKCKVCKQVYAKTSMKAHMVTHSIDTQHECSICNKSFTTKWNLKIHNWVHANRTAKPFKCEHCVKAFVREIDYKNHINSHKHIKPFTCEYCGCKFIRKYNYMRHRQEHTGQKRFKCDLCGKLFHRNYYLIEHRRTHTGERPFLCTICGKSSTTKTNHNKHLKIHHSRDPFTSEA